MEGHTEAKYRKIEGQNLIHESKIIQSDTWNCLLIEDILPLPFLSLFYGQCEDAFKYQNENRDGQIPLQYKYFK